MCCISSNHRWPSFFSNEPCMLTIAPNGGVYMPFVQVNAPCKHTHKHYFYICMQHKHFLKFWCHMGGAFLSIHVLGGAMHSRSSTMHVPLHMYAWRAKSLHAVFDEANKTLSTCHACILICYAEKRIQWNVPQQWYKVQPINKPSVDCTSTAWKLAGGYFSLVSWSAIYTENTLHLEKSACTPPWSRKRARSCHAQMCCLTMQL